MTRSRATAKQAGRIKVACINWSWPREQWPNVPKALTYVLRDDEMIAESYHSTWAEAMARAEHLATLFRKVIR